jgi:hypothetical protein
VQESQEQPEEPVVLPELVSGLILVVETLESLP